jgi:hypothetical protein
MQRDLVRMMRGEDGNRDTGESRSGESHEAGIEQVRLDDVDSLAAQLAGKPEQRPRISRTRLSVEGER